MKLPRRNSLTFPLTHEPFDSFTDLVPKRSIGNPLFPFTKEIDKALTIMNDDNVSTKSIKSTSTTSHSTDSNEELHVSNHSIDTIEDDEVLRMHYTVAKETTAISTPMPARKKTLQIPMAKRKEIASLGAKESYSTSAALPLYEHKSKSKRSIVSKSPSSLLEDTPSRDPCGKSSLRNTSKNGRKQRNKIHFKQTCTMRRILSRKDMTPKEIRRTWLSAKEYRKMQVRDEILADRIDAGQSKEETCTRGLESKIEVSALKKLNLRMTGTEAVLMEQKRQWDEAGDAVLFFYDFSAFTYVYTPVSEKALATAQAMAKWDRLEAEIVLASSSFLKDKGSAGFLKRSRFTRRRSVA